MCPTWEFPVPVNPLSTKYILIQFSKKSKIFLFLWQIKKNFPFSKLKKNYTILYIPKFQQILKFSKLF